MYAKDLGHMLCQLLQLVGFDADRAGDQKGTMAAIGKGQDCRLGVERVAEIGQRLLPLAASGTGVRPTPVWFWVNDYENTFR